MARVNIIPMAGVGSRFADAGYRLPKALIPVSGRPMILRVVELMPPADAWIFLVRKEHVDAYGIDRLLTGAVPNARVIEIEKTTEGQASTCMLALPFVRPEDELFIAACDNSFLYNTKRFTALTKDPSIDSVLWTFTRSPLITEKPTAWGWVRLGADGATVDDMSVKVPVSDDPYNDHAVVATFWFRRASDFAAAYDLMVRENYRINNEFYVDSIPIFMKKLGKKTVIFDVDLYVGWGKPADLYQYDAEEFRVRHGGKSVSKERDLWGEFFARLDAAAGHIHPRDL